MPSRATEKLSNKTLVIILSETRASELTYSNFKKNVIDELNADLCICIGVKSDYDYNNPFFQYAKYKFLHDEPLDYADAFNYAYSTFEIPKYEYFDNQNKRPLFWREFLKIKNHILGGVKDNTNQHPGSAGILIFYRWFLLKNLLKNKLIDKYDKFVITRSDFIYQLPHPKVEKMDEKNIWIPDGEHYGGYTDRHVVLSKSNIEPYLNIFNNMVLRSNEYFMKMKIYNEWNLEQLIKFHLQQNNILSYVKFIPYIMYAVRNINGNTRWSYGEYSNELGYYIKYNDEYNKSSYYKKHFEESGKDIDNFYKEILYN